MRPKSTPSCVRQFGEHFHFWVLSFVWTGFQNTFQKKRVLCFMTFYVMATPRFVWVWRRFIEWAYLTCLRFEALLQGFWTSKHWKLNCTHIWYLLFSPHILLIFDHPTIWTIQNFLAYVFGARSVSIRYLLDRCTVKVNLFVHGSYRNYCSSGII